MWTKKTRFWKNKYEKKTVKKDNERKPCEFFTIQINNGQTVQILENISDITYRTVVSSSYYHDGAICMYAECPVQHTYLLQTIE